MCQPPQLQPVVAITNFFVIREPFLTPKSKRVFVKRFNQIMKGLSVIITAFILVFGTVASRGADLARISDETGVPVATLQAERASTGLGWGELEKAHLLANSSGKSFDEIVALRKGGQGWGNIARDNGLNLGKVVSDARQSSKATMHAQDSDFISGSNGKQGIDRMGGKGMDMGSKGMGSKNHGGHGR
jgi:hypothetical protein